MKRRKNIKRVPNTPNNTVADKEYAHPAPISPIFFTSGFETKNAVTLARTKPSNKYTCFLITVSITCSITANAKNAPPINKSIIWSVRNDDSYIFY